ncbi:MAG: phage Gp37/Gp68 family protein, partial [Oscillospiraceae bacterium]|nr:phage Gp37/Gp68 family protein [Oscillospiraceae bacterium]
MATKIEWTEETWNPVTGCTKYSAGCEHCYAAAFARRLQAMGNSRYKNGFKVTVHRDLFQKPLEWAKPKMIFVNSMSDLFHEDVSDEDVLAIFETMNKASQHTFQVLTKRSERVIALSPRIKWTNNIWMGVSIENTASIYRCEDLKRTGAKVKFISAEPLLESISQIDLDGIDWLIVGGESGPQSRPMEEAWVEELRD